MSKSNFFSPGAYDELNGTTVHVTSVFANPSCLAIAYATALSKPLPFDGSSSTKYGGNAGLSVPTVSVPGANVASWSFVQFWAVVAAAWVLPEPLSSLPPHAAIANSAATSSRASR